MTKLVFFTLMTVLMTGCITRIDQPQPDEWEYFYKYKKGDTPFEVVKRDMLACGFDTPSSGYIEGEDEHLTKYINAVFCMESKGYHNAGLPKGVCERYKEEPACQKNHSQ